MPVPSLITPDWTTGLYSLFARKTKEFISHNSELMQQFSRNSGFMFRVKTIYLNNNGMKKLLDDALTLVILAGGRDVRQLLLSRNWKWIENLLRIDFGYLPSYHRNFTLVMFSYEGRRLSFLASERK
jgi:hypothetical protein